MKSRWLVVVGALAFILVAVGCRKGGQTPPAPAGDWQITPQGLGNIRIGENVGKAREALTAAGYQVRDMDRQLEGTPSPTLVANWGGEDVLFVELNPPEKVWRLELLGAQWSTPEGIHVGSTFTDLARKYRQGDVVQGEGNTCVVYRETLPGISFCLNPAMIPEGPTPPPWSQLAHIDPAITSILITGPTPPK